MTDHLRRLLAEPAIIKGRRATRGERIARVLVEQAESGAEWAVRYLIDRLDGRPATLTELELRAEIAELQRVVASRLNGSAPRAWGERFGSGAENGH